MFTLCPVFNVDRYMEILKRINDLIIASNLTPRSFAIACDIKYTTLNNYLTGRRALGLDTVELILSNFTNVSAEWLMRGEGPMYKSDITNQSNERLNKLIATIGEMQSILEEKQKQIDVLMNENTQLKKSK